MNQKNIKNIKGINGAKIRQARKEKAWKIKDLSVKTGLTESSLSMLETEKISPNIKTVRLIAEKLGISVDWLMDIPISNMPDIINVYNDLSKTKQVLLYKIAKLMLEKCD